MLQLLQSSCHSKRPRQLLPFLTRSAFMKQVTRRLMTQNRNVLGKGNSWETRTTITMFEEELMYFFSLSLLQSLSLLSFFFSLLTLYKLFIHSFIISTSLCHRSFLLNNPLIFSLCYSFFLFFFRPFLYLILFESRDWFSISSTSFHSLFFRNVEKGTRINCRFMAISQGLC